MHSYFIDSHSFYNAPPFFVPHITFMFTMIFFYLSHELHESGFANSPPRRPKTFRLRLSWPVGHANHVTLVNVTFAWLSGERMPPTPVSEPAGKVVNESTNLVCFCIRDQCQLIPLDVVLRLVLSTVATLLQPAPS